MQVTYTSYRSGSTSTIPEYVLQWMTPTSPNPTAFMLVVYILVAPILKSNYHKTYAMHKPLTKWTRLNQTSCPRPKSWNYTSDKSPAKKQNKTKKRNNCLCIIVTTNMFWRWWWQALGRDDLKLHWGQNSAWWRQRPL